MEFPLRRLALAALAALAAAAVLPAQEGGEGGAAVPTVIKPMPDMGDSELGRILNRYYERGLGGEDQWKSVESIRIDGTLRLGETAYGLRAYQKKPNHLKMVIDGPGGEAVFAYDGETAWRLEPGNDEPVEMTGQEARRFIHNAGFDTYLLYPLAPGKKIEFVETVPARGKLCHQVRVTLDTGYSIDYFIDIHDFRVLSSLSTDRQTGEVVENVYEDFAEPFGVPMARKVTSYENGEVTSVVEVDRFTANVGAMPWMFSKPGGLTPGQ
jgi:hypothetical protein